MALARYIVVLFRVLHRKGHKKLAVDGNDVKRGIGIRQLWIDKRWRRGHSVKIDIIHFHHATPEIGGIQAGHAICIRGDGESFLDGSGLRVGVGVKLLPELSTAMIPYLPIFAGSKLYGLTPGLQPTIVPSSVAKMKTAGADVLIVVCVDAGNLESWRGARQRY